MSKSTASWHALTHRQTDNAKTQCWPADWPLTSSDNIWNLIYLATEVLSEIYRRCINEIIYLSIYLSNASDIIYSIDGGITEPVKTGSKKRDRCFHSNQISSVKALQWTLSTRSKHKQDLCNMQPQSVHTHMHGHKHARTHTYTRPV